MYKKLSFIIVLFCVNVSQAQTELEMQQWLTRHSTFINLNESRGKNNRYGLKSIEFTKYGIEAKGENGQDFTARSTFDTAYVENDFLIIRDRAFGYFVKLKIANAGIRQQYKEIFTRYAYTQLNTSEEDFPIYEKEKVDKAAVVSDEPDGWKKFLLKYLVFNPAYKHNVTPGTYEAEIQFVVTHEGRIKDFKKIGNNPKGIHEMMLYMITRSRSTNWVPARLNGKNVSSYVKIKITLVVKPLAPDAFRESLYYDRYKDVNLNLDDYENKYPGKRSIPKTTLKGEYKSQINIANKEIEVDKTLVVKEEKLPTEVFENNEQKIFSQQIAEKCENIRSLQTGVNGNLFTDLKTKTSYRVTFPSDNFNILFSKGLAYQAIYKELSTSTIKELYLTENIDMSKAVKIVSSVLSKNSMLQRIIIEFPKGSITTNVVVNGQVIRTIQSNTLDFYYRTDDVYAENRLQRVLLELVYDSQRLKREHSKKQIN